MANKIIPSHMPCFNSIIETYDALLVKYQSGIEQNPKPASEFLSPVNQWISNGIVGIGLLDMMFPEAFSQLKDV